MLLYFFFLFWFDVCIASEGDSIIVHAPVDPSIPQGRRRKKRTSIDQKRRGVLDDMFNKVSLYYFSTYPTPVCGSFHVAMFYLLPDILQRAWKDRVVPLMSLTAK